MISDEMYPVFLLCWLLSLQVLTNAVDDVNPLVFIPSLGSIRGSVMKSAFRSREFLAFRGIPYARPPLGNLRFQDPLPAEAWTGRELDATKEGPSCVYYDTFGQTVSGVEDCLVLNVYTPNTEGDEFYPVMVWIPGGGFIRGDGNGEKGLYGPKYLLDREIVLVTMNYRVGPFGFLSTGDDEAPGNYGLLDQVLALKWVRDHIKHFGGNPESVTIFGESAGGACIEFHLLSPLSKDLFQRAIAQSGAATASWAVHDHVKEWTLTLVQDLNCPNATSKEILACLREASANSIAEFRKKIALPFAYELFPLAFGPRIDLERDNPFLPAHPLDLMAEGNFNKVPYITGVTKNEGIILTSTLIGPGNQRNMDTFNLDPINAIRHFLSIEKEQIGREVAQLVHDEYLTTSRSYATQINELERLSSDSGFFKPFELSVDLITGTSDQPVFTYLYCYNGTFSYYSIIGAPPDPDYGVGHGDELMFMFSSNYAPKLESPGDIVISETLIDLFTSFASNGTPTSEHLKEEWVPYANHRKRYLQIGGPPGEERTVTKLVEGEMPFHERMAFWDGVLHPKRKAFHSTTETGVDKDSFEQKDARRDEL